MTNTVKTLVQKFVGGIKSNDNEVFSAIDKSQGIIAFSLDRRILAANDILHKIFGYSSGEMMTLDFGMLVDHEYRDSAQYHKFWQKLNSGEFESGEFLFRTRDGKELWIHATYSPVRDQDGRLIKIVGLMTDITATKSEQIEELNELKVRASITNQTSIVSDSNLKGEILTINDKYVEVSKYSKEELIGQPHSITRHPDMPKEVFKQVWATIGRGETFRGIIKNRAKDGTAYFVDAVIAPVMGKNGKPRKYIGVRYDITEAELERQNMKGVFDAIDSYYAYTELDLEGKVLTANKNFLKLMEYQEEDVVGKHHRIFVDPNIANSGGYSHFWDSLKAGNAQTDTYKRVTQTGKGVWLQATYSPIKDEMGRIVKFVEIASDVTQEKLEVVGQLDAIGKAQALVEFSMEGSITSVNDNFLNIVGYTKNEVVGQHYNFLLDPVNRNEPEHRELWEKLQRGENDANQLNFIGKDGRSLWIQAFSCSLVDLNNKPFKVVMYATDISQQINTTRMLQAAVEQTKVVISSAQEGDLAQRVSLEDKEGEIAHLCTSVNSLLELTDRVMGEVGHVLAALAKGDLNERIDASYQGDFGKLTDNVNLTAGNLQKIVGSIAESAKIISITSGEIVSGNTDLSTRTEKQAANLEETAASIEELTSTVKQNADNANHANERAIGASGVAEKGGEVVNQVVKTMSSIDESSKKIVDIISVIDGIAFQTNILALNAAVEAARAGEQGRGFAVVATEVRNLAQRSAAAAKEIKTLISDSVCKVEDGTRLVDEAGETMTEIVVSIKHVTDIMAEITSASHEQSMGIGQVNEAINQIDEVTQQNAALVEQSTAAAMEMENQARELTKAISVFNLNNAEYAHDAPQRPERRSVENRPFSDSQRQGEAPVKPKSQLIKQEPSVNKVASAGGNDDGWSEF